MTGAPQMSAEDVLNYTLERTGEGLDTGDFDVFRSQFHLPHKVSTFDCESVMETLEDMRVAFDRVRAHLKTIGATAIIRHVLTAAYKTPTQVEGVHLSHVMNGDVRIKEPYPVFSIIQWIEGSWRIVSSDYAIDPADPQSAVIAAKHSPIVKPTHSVSNLHQ